MMVRARSTRDCRLVLGATVALVLALAFAPAPPALAGTANAGMTLASLAGAPAGDPIAGLTWGYYAGNVDDVYDDYEASTGSRRNLLGEVAMRPEAYWFGSWDKKPRKAAAEYIASVTEGDPNVLAQLTDFRVGPWEDKICGRIPSAASIRSYKSWETRFAQGIGNSRALVLVQPDLPIANVSCITHKTRRVYLNEIKFEVQKLNALKHTTVYLDAGSSDWLNVKEVAALLIRAGVRYARGFGLDATHFDSTQHEIAYGEKVVRLLAARGLRGKHFLVDTSENGSPFTHQAYTNAGHSGRHWATRPGCIKVGKPRFCQTFGIPPTWQTGLARWRLGAHYNAIARRYVDGYVWFGRPWMKGQSNPFDPPLTEQMARSSPFPYPTYGEPLPQESDNTVPRFGQFGSRRGEAIRS